MAAHCAQDVKRLEQAQFHKTRLNSTLTCGVFHVADQVQTYLQNHRQQNASMSALGHPDDTASGFP
jgi:hypothetical protein